MSEEKTRLTYRKYYWIHDILNVYADMERELFREKIWDADAWTNDFSRYFRGFLAELSLAETLMRLGFNVAKFAPKVYSSVPLRSPDFIISKDAWVALVECKYSQREELSIRGSQYEHETQFKESFGINDLLLAWDRGKTFKFDVASFVAHEFKYSKAVGEIFCPTECWIVIPMNWMIEHGADYRITTEDVSSWLKNGILRRVHVVRPATMKRSEDKIYLYAQRKQISLKNKYQVDILDKLYKRLMFLGEFLTLSVEYIHALLSLCQRRALIFIHLVVCDDFFNRIEIPEGALKLPVKWDDYLLRVG